MRKAFTLIELLVVVSIIALLIAILLPVLGSARIVARDAQDLANIRSFSQSCFTWAADNKGFLPPGDNAASAGSYAWFQDDIRRRLVKDYGVLEREFGCYTLESFESKWNSIGLYRYNYKSSGHSVIGWNYYGGRKPDNVELVSSPGEFYVPPYRVEDIKATSQTLATCMMYDAATPGAGWESISPHASPGVGAFIPGGEDWIEMDGVHTVKLDGSAHRAAYEALEALELNDYIYYESD